jgi:hypothetical protein
VETRGPELCLFVGYILMELESQYVACIVRFSGRFLYSDNVVFCVSSLVCAVLRDSQLHIVRRARLSRRRASTYTLDLSSGFKVLYLA